MGKIDKIFPFFCIPCATFGQKIKNKNSCFHAQKHWSNFKNHEINKMNRDNNSTNQEKSAKS